jgi:hypothetical protein
MMIMVCGPYRADTIAQVHRNIQAAREVAEAIWQRGHYAFCPHLNSAFMDWMVDDKAFLDFGLLMVEKVDAIYMVDGWKNSDGAFHELEKACAASNVKVIFYSVADVPVVPW